MGLAEDLRVCVTGGASGLGLSVAEEFQAQGARVHVCDASAEAMAQALGTHRGLHGTVAEIESPSDVDEFVDEAVDWMGGVDVLVHTARMDGPRSPVEKVLDEDWDATLRRDLTGLFHVVRRVVPQMKEQGGGCILSLVSSVSRTGRPLCSPLVASSAAVVGLSHGLARELGPHGIRCNVILPGHLRHSSRRSAGGDSGASLRLFELDAEPSAARFDEEDLDFVSLRRAVEPREVARTAVFLASEAASSVTGQVLGVCGNVEWEG